MYYQDKSLIEKFYSSHQILEPLGCLGADGGECKKPLHLEQQ